MPMILNMRKTSVRAWRGYRRVREMEVEDGVPLLPRRLVWMEPEASQALEAMQEACDFRMEFAGCYRSVPYQARMIREQGEQHRRLAKPTKSGHNFGFSVDVKISETLENFTKSGNAVLIAAGRDYASLKRWMKQFGFTGVKYQTSHFNYLGKFTTAVKKIEEIYAPSLKLTNEEVQQALNKLLSKQLSEPLIVDGIIGTKTGDAGDIADELLATKDKGAFGHWFRRVLAGSVITINEVS